MKIVWILEVKLLDFTVVGVEPLCPQSSLDQRMHVDYAFVWVC